MNMTNDAPVTYPRTVHFIDSWYWPEWEWTFIKEGEIIVEYGIDHDAYDTDEEYYLKEDESFAIVKIDLISNVMKDNTPLMAIAHAFHQAQI